MHDSVFIVGHHHHHCFSDFSIGFGFGFGWGFPYYASYYAAYPYYYPYPYYPYYPYYYDYYPYRYGVYASYPPPVYVYHEAPPPAASPSSAPAEAVPTPARGPQGEEDITPIPPEEMLDRASADKAPSVRGEIAERTALNGLAEFRSGSYSDAAETLFSAVQADPSSPTLKVYLAEALYAMGEYKFSAEYLRQALEARPDLIQKSFNPSRLYAPSPQGEQDLAEHYEQLSSWTALRPYDTDALLVLGFVQLQSGRPAEAGATLIALRDGSATDRTLADRLLAESEVRGGARPQAVPALSPEPADEDERLGQVLVASLEQ